MNIPENAKLAWEKHIVRNAYQTRDRCIYVFRAGEFHFEVSYDPSLWNDDGGWRVNVVHIFLGLFNLYDNNSIFRSYGITNEQNFKNLELNISHFIKDYFEAKNTFVKTPIEDILLQTLKELNE